MSLLPIIIAGLINGSFVVPVRLIKNASNEKIWFYHSLIGFSLIPWVILFFLSSSVFQDYVTLAPNLWGVIIVGGLIFGFGQVCFSYAIKKIGMAISFAINLGIGVTLGSMYVVFHDSALSTTQSYLVTLAVLCIVLSLVFYYFSEKIKTHYHTGWLLALFAGIASGFQNITFVYVGFYANAQFHSMNSFWVWPPFLLAAAVPMVILFFTQMKRNHENLSLPTFNSLILVGLMGLSFTGSLALYSSGMSQLLPEQKMIGWPILNVLIILTSQVWGGFFGELQNTHKIYRIISLLLLIISIGLLSIRL
ncbi:MAG TPA: hypothetical protein VGV92_00675 [Gammaproteobacteria bacterium]|nr:hypothetical protein [Gammaproteobacteria bacterium]